MGEETIKIEARKTVWVCNKCEAGEMLPTNNKEIVSGDEQHQCDNCGALAVFSVRYPIIKECK